MPEHEIIHVALLLRLRSELIQKLFRSAELVVRMLVATRLGPGARPAESDRRMDGREEPLNKMAVEDAEQESIAPRRAAQPVAVPKAEILIAQPHEERLLEIMHSQLLKQGESPDIVVAGAEPHLHAFVHQADQLRHHAQALAGHHVMVLKPKVPDVAQQVQPGD